MSRDTQPHAVVVGGSLGGLVTAAALRAINWDVTVYEASAHELESRGGGVVLQPDVIHAFEFADVALPHPPGVLSGDRIYLDETDRIVSRFSMPQMQTSWSLLYKALKRAQPDGGLRAGERFTRFEDDGERVTAHFESGHRHTADLLIGADGVRSTLRTLLEPDTKPRYAGYVAWRGLIEEPELAAFAADKLRDRFAFSDGVGHSALAYMVPGEDDSTEPGRRRWNWVWYRRYDTNELQDLLVDRDGVQQPFSLPPGTAKQMDIDRLKDEAQTLLGPTFRALVHATDIPFMQPIVDVQTRSMRYGRVLLTGDAASVPRPHTAGSTAKAAANAYALARELEAAQQPQHTGESALDRALSRWNAEQMRVGRAMTTRGIMLGNQLMRIPAHSV
jgi:2-polyprenyl-6-methoxyphenol hydroxylase-like FAD-dependent oxidoreductase